MSIRRIIYHGWGSLTRSFSGWRNWGEGLGFGGATDRAKAGGGDFEDLEADGPGGGAEGVEDHGGEVIEVVGEGRENESGEAVGDDDEDFVAEGIAKERKELFGEDGGGDDGLGALEFGVLDDVLAISLVAGFEGSEIGVGIFAGLVNEEGPGDIEGLECGFGEGLEAIWEEDSCAENGAFGAIDGLGEWGLGGHGFEPDAPSGVRICGRGVGEKGGEDGEEEEGKIFSFPVGARVGQDLGMITFLEGILCEALPTYVVIGVHGIGYHVSIPLSSYDKLPVTGQPIKILTHLQVREDAHVLYGFATSAERDLFRLLVTHVSGIGPKTALDVLSGISVTMFKAAVVNGDVGLLSKTKGVGKKTAERMIVELKDKVGIAAAWEAASLGHAPTEAEVQVSDAVLALIALGYRQVEAHQAVKSIQEKAKGVATTEELIRQGLQLLL